MLNDALFMGVGVGLLTAGAVGLVRGGTALALRLGLPPLVVGLTVVAFGTSMPELVVSVRAALDGRGAIAVGNVVGSNICNIGLILGLSAIIRPLSVRAQVIRFDVPIVIGCSLLAGWLLRDGALGRPEAALLAAGIVSYTAFSVWAARREPQAVVHLEFAEGLPAVRGRAWRDLVLLPVGLALLLLGARLFVDGAVSVAGGFGVSPAVVGLTIVATGTSLPELATSLVAAARGAGDIGVGNAVGSNVFNLLAVLGAAGLARPLSDSGIASVDLLLMIGLVVVLLPVMRTGFTISRLEGLALVGVYVAYTAWLLR
jgi:cation:H+ antiporter